MNIDFSVLIWTIVDFLILMVLLNLVLYRPILRHMNERRKRTDEGVEAGRLAEKTLDERSQTLNNELDSERKQAALQCQQSASDTARFREEAFAAAELGVADKRDEVKAKLKATEKELIAELTPDMDELAKLLAVKLLGDGTKEE
ncbi:MAG TPA: hypothetical protein P5116_05240 [Eubacteriales bacterium]|nr:hypothetical protein [Clostridia bacterium]HRV73262.1 hypothetical protein [Eubacteriales bacterium]